MEQAQLTLSERCGDAADLMRHNEKLDYDKLRAEAEAAVEESGKKRIEIASELGVSSGAITRALKEPGSKFSELQKRIVEHLTDYRIDEENYTIFRVQRKD